MEAAGRAEVRTPDDERATNTPLRDSTSLAKRVRVLEAELARKNEIVAELGVLLHLPKKERKPPTPVSPNTGFVERIHQLEAEVARKNEVIAELAVLVLQAQGLLKGKTCEGEESGGS